MAPLDLFGVIRAAGSLRTRGMVSSRLFLALTSPAVVAVVAVVGACSQPPHVSLEEETASYHVELELDGATLGRRTASIEVTDADGEPVDAERVVVSTAMPSMGMDGPTIVAEEVEPGRYEANGSFFTMLGESTLTVRIEAGAGSDEEATFAVEAKP